MLTPWEFSPPTIVSGWLGCVNALFRVGEIGEVSDADLLNGLTRSDRASFRRLTGKTPKRLLREWRVEYGLWMMSSKGYNTAQAAVEAGFYDSSHFIHCCTTVRGYTPRRLITARFSA